MKKLAVMLGVCAVAAGAFAQGTVQFFPTPSTLASATINGTTAATSGAAGSYYFGLLTSATPTGTFSFTGSYATNLVQAGFFGTPAAVTVSGWAAGATLSYKVAMWSSSLGTTFNPNWLAGNFGAASGVFGLSAVATGASGGLGVPATPPLSLFGSTGITTGILGTQTTVVPEPSSMALAGLGAAALLIFRRRK